MAKSVKHLTGLWCNSDCFYFQSEHKYFCNFYNYIKTHTKPTDYSYLKSSEFTKVLPEEMGMWPQE